MKELGQPSEYKFTAPTVGMLDSFPNPSPGREYTITLKTGEFTSLCPITGQPDFADVVIEYVPGRKCVETKSLKLYLFAFRNEGAFMEATCNKIISDLCEAVAPHSCSVTMAFGVRGGILTTVTARR